MLSPMLARLGRRLLALAAFGAAGLAVYVALQPALSPRPAAGVEAAAAAGMPRPQAAPAHVPAWAWQLDTWLVHRSGPRPKAAPAHVPDWYWAWRTWRRGVSPRSAAPPRA